MAPYMEKLNILREATNSLYLLSAIYDLIHSRDVFWPLNQISKIELFAKIAGDFSAVNYFCKKAPS